MINEFYVTKGANISFRFQFFTEHVYAWDICNLFWKKSHKLTDYRCRRVFRHITEETISVHFKAIYLRNYDTPSAKKNTKNH